MSLLELCKGVVKIKIPVEAYKLERIMQPDYHTMSHKRRVMDPLVPPYKDDRDLDQLRGWLQGCFENYTYLSEQTGDDIDHMNAAMFKLRIIIGKYSNLDG